MGNREWTLGNTNLLRQGFGGQDGKNVEAGRQTRIPAGLPVVKTGL